jgi:L-aminopeptidase/D-esterase-like protein
VDAGTAHAPPSGWITEVSGLRVGHFTNARRSTGCTAIIFDEPAAAAVDYDGSAPGEMLVVLLQPVSPVDRIHAILLSGGGVMGLVAVAGAMRFLEERKIGFDWGSPSVRIPIVVGAIIDDLAVGDARIRPDAESAYKACEAAAATPVAEGNVGAGAGGTVRRMLPRRGRRSRAAQHDTGRGRDECGVLEDRADQDRHDGERRRRLDDPPLSDDQRRRPALRGLHGALEGRRARVGHRRAGGGKSWPRPL